MKAKTNQTPLVTFIVICWNNRDLLDDCFSSIYAQSYSNFNVIMVDNASGDDSVAFTRQKYPRVDILQAAANNGFAIGNNQGIAQALENPECAYVALVNTDARMDPDWLETLIAFASEHPHGASFQTTTVDYYNHQLLDSRGILIDHQGRAMQLGHQQPVQNYPTRQVYGVNAAAAVFSGTFLRDQPFGDDYFDSDMWMYLEDVDLATRAVMMGWDNWYVNQSTAYHMGSASSNKNPGFSVYMSYRNNLYLLVKNYPLSVILRILPGLIATDLQSIYRHLRGRNKRAIKAMLKGRMQSVVHVGIFLKKRSVMKRVTRISSRQLWSLMRDDPRTAD